MVTSVFTLTDNSILEISQRTLSLQLNQRCISYIVSD